MKPRKRTVILGLAAAVVLVAVPAYVWAAGNEAHAESEICLKLLRPIELVNLYKLDLGRHVFNDDGSTAAIWIDTGGGTEVSDNLMTLEPGYPAVFKATGEKGCAFHIELHNGVLYNQMDSQHKLEAEVYTDEYWRYFPDDYMEEIVVGAHVEIPPGQMTGVYQGHFEAWVFYL